MLYIKVSSEAADARAQLQYVCKSCGNVVDESAEAGASCIVDTNYMDDQTTYQQYANKYITHDPTLPRVRNITCPSDKCTKPPAALNEVIYVKYDFKNLRFLYHCTHCSHFWKSGAASEESASV
jgi:DNA-directed RNA polymerase subunit M/transcription elongation factor TFIIS